MDNTPGALPNQNIPNTYYNNQQAYNNIPNQSYSQIQPNNISGYQQPYVQVNPHFQQNVVYNNQAQVIGNFNQGVQMQVINTGHNNKIHTNPLEELQHAKQAIVKQKLEILEIISGCETANRYYVSIKDPLTGDKKDLFKCKEESGFCMRYCCSSEMRSFKMKIKDISHGNDKNEGEKKQFAILDRPFTCTCCCLARPEMSAKIGDKFIGKVFEPCTVCDPLFHILDHNNNIKWKIHTEYCQCGVCCRSTYGRCSEVYFPIYSGSTEEFDKNKSDGFVKKVFKARELISDASTFHIDFPSNATAEDKFMIIATVLMIDYQYYEESQSDSNHHY